LRLRCALLAARTLLRSGSAALLLPAAGKTKSFSDPLTKASRYFQVVSNVLNTRNAFCHVLCHALLMAVFHIAEQDYLSVHYPDFHVRRVDVRVLRETLTNVLANSVI
jgi:hypothetical protein